MYFPLAKSMQQGFTLIELIIVIVMLSALGIMTSSYIGTGVDIYMGISERDKGLSSVRFVMERLRREVGNALPNSAFVTDSVVDGECLTFTPIIASSIYSSSDFPIGSTSEPNTGAISSIDGYSFKSGDQAVVYLLNVSDRDDTDQVNTISSIDASNETLTFASNVSFILDSDLDPSANRIYIIRDDTTYCFKNNNLYRSDDSVSNVLMAENITGSFAVSGGTELADLFVRVSYTLDFDGQEAEFEQILHINNVP